MIICTIRVKRVIKEINDLKINKKNSIAMQIDINSRKQLNKPENYAAFYSLLNRLPTSDREALKESIVSQYTDGRTTSLREMTLKEYSAAVAAMQKLVPPTYQEQPGRFSARSVPRCFTRCSCWASIRPTGTG